MTKTNFICFILASVTLNAAATMGSRQDVRTNEVLQSSSVSKTVLPQNVQTPAVEKPAHVTKGRCDPMASSKPNLSGEYSAVMYPGDGAIGKPVVMKIEGDSFRLLSDGAAAEGRISFVNTCGYTATAIKFSSASGDFARIPALTDSSISLESRQVGMAAGDKSNGMPLRTNSPIVLATTRDQEGRFAGPDIAILICPAYPDCLKYPKCPCPTPEK